MYAMPLSARTIGQCDSQWPVCTTPGHESGHFDPTQAVAIWDGLEKKIGPKVRIKAKGINEMCNWQKHLKVYVRKAQAP